MTAVLADPLIAPRVAADRVRVDPATTDVGSLNADFFRATVSTSYRDPDYMDADPDEIPLPTPGSSSTNSAPPDGGSSISIAPPA